MTPPNALLEPDRVDEPIALPAPRRTRPLYWSLRRELWENRSLYLAPLFVAAVFLLGFLISTITLPRRMRAALLLAPAKQLGAITIHYDLIALLLIVVAFVVGFFYCLDALYGERRDRSILFWKSLPVSDRTTVLAKASIPLAVLPLLTFAVIVASQTIMLLLSTAVLVTNGPALTMLWARLPIVRLWLALLYSLIATALWHAPIYAWLLLVSGWAKRAVFLWAVLPFVAVAAFERSAFHTSVIGSLLQYRLIGWFHQAFVPAAAKGEPIDPLHAIDAARFFTTPGLWIGLLFAALFLAAAIRLRRDREPI